MIRKSLIIVMPIKSEDEIDRAVDTICSVEHYISTDYQIVVLQGREGICDNLKKLFPSIIVVRGSDKGPFGHLYVSLADAFRFILEQYKFDALLRLDTDALIIGYHPEKDAISYFEEHPDIGMLGSYKKDCRGNIRDFGPVRKILKEEVGLIKRITRPELVKTLKKLLEYATINGYELGEHCLGAAYFVSYRCLLAMQQESYLSLDALKHSRLSDDHIISLIVRTSGYGIGDFSTDNYPICIKWRGLPYPPQQLIAKRKKIIHSTKSYKNFNELETREYFRNLRNSEIKNKNEKEK